MKLEMNQATHSILVKIAKSVLQDDFHMLMDARQDLDDLWPEKINDDSYPILCDYVERLADTMFGSPAVVSDTETLLYFDNHQEAINYKRDSGCWGWLFENDNGTAIIYPWTWNYQTVSDHWTISGQSGHISMSGRNQE